MKSLSAIILLASLNSLAFQQIGEEELMGAQIYGRTVKIQVRSGGCTYKDSFAIKKSLNIQSNSTELTFLRIKPDNCEAYIPEGRVFSFSMTELRMRSGQNFKIKNSFLVN